MKKHIAKGSKQNQKGNGLPSSYFNDGLTYVDSRNYLPLEVVEPSQTYLSPIVNESRPPFIYQFGGGANKSTRTLVMDNLFKDYKGTGNICGVAYSDTVKKKIVGNFLKILKEKLNNN